MELDTMKPIKFNLGWAILEPTYESLWLHAGRLWISTESRAITLKLKAAVLGFEVVTVDLSDSWSCAIKVGTMVAADDIISWEYTAFRK